MCNKLGDCFQSLISWKIKFEYLINKKDKKGKSKIYVPSENGWVKIKVICKIFISCLPWVTIFKTSLFVTSIPRKWSVYLKALP